MANTCAICGATINVFQAQKLADGNYLCRKKALTKYFDFVGATLPSFQAHAAQVEKGTKIWNELFVPNLKGKSIKKTVSPVYVAPDLRLFVVR